MLPPIPAELTVTPGFLQPLTPGNLSVGPSGTATITGSMTEVGGNGGVRFALASDTAGTPSVAGSLSEPHCVRGSVEGSNPAYTVCSVTYTAPALMPASSSVYIVGSVASSSTLSWTRVLLECNRNQQQSGNASGAALGSGAAGLLDGNNSDYDASLGQLSDCCGGTLGALLQDNAGNEYVLSNNHVLARSDQSPRRDNHSARIDRQWLHSVWRRTWNYTGGYADRVSGAQLRNQCRRRHCAGDCGSGRSAGKHSGAGSAAGRRDAGSSAARDLVDEWQGRTCLAGHDGGEERTHDGADLRGGFRIRCGCCPSTTSPTAPKRGML
jgi:hypothetical protein